MTARKRPVSKLFTCSALVLSLCVAPAFSQTAGSSGGAGGAGIGGGAPSATAPGGSVSPSAPGGPGAGTSDFGLGGTGSMDAPGIYDSPGIADVPGVQDSGDTTNLPTPDYTGSLDGRETDLETPGSNSDADIGLPDESESTNNSLDSESSAEVPQGCYGVMAMPGC